MGIYFLETGISQRASTVLYDRAKSSIAVAPASAYDWKKLLAGRDAFHTTGITPALTAVPKPLATRWPRRRSRANLPASISITGPSSGRGKTRTTVGPLIKNVDLLIGNEEDAKDVLGIAAEKTDVRAGHVDRAAYEEVAGASAMNMARGWSPSRSARANRPASTISSAPAGRRGVPPQPTVHDSSDRSHRRRRPLLWRPSRRAAR